MYCLKCGRETEDEQAFCLECQKIMAKYPIDPNAMVQLPSRKQSQPKKPVKRRVTPEDQIKALKRQVRVLTCLLLATVALAVCLSVPVIRNYGKQKFQIGQNYTTVKPKSETIETGTSDQ